MRRRDPRYYESRVVEDPENWAEVQFAERFGKMRVFHGKLYDLTPRAVRVVLEKDAKKEVENSIGVGAYVKFHIRDELPTTVHTAIIARIDDLPDWTGVVLFFEMMKEPERAAIEKVCRAFEARYKSKTEGDDNKEGQAPK